MKIILKVDDFWGGSSLTIPIWGEFLNVARDLGIKIDLGIIGASLKNSPTQTKMFYDENKEWIEIYNHSLNHIVAPPVLEFFGQSVGYQRNSIFKTQELIARYLEIICRVIGFPANTFDFDTLNIIQEFPEIKKVFAYSGFSLYNEIEKTGKRVIDINGYGLMEYNFKGVGIVKPDVFVKNFKDGGEYLCYQLHPNNYNKKDVENFKEIIKFLLSKNNQFVWASEL